MEKISKTYLKLGGALTSVDANSCPLKGGY